MGERGVDRAFGQSSRFRERAKACLNRTPFLAHALAVEMQKNQVGRGFLIVANQISHQHVEDVIIDWDGDLKSLHNLDLNIYTNKGTTLFHVLARLTLDANASRRLASLHHD